MNMDDRVVSGSHQHNSWDIDVRDVVDSIEDELMIIDTEYHVRLVNSAMRQEMGENAPCPIGMTCYEAFHHRDSPCGAPLWDCPLKKVVQSGNAIGLVHPIRSSGSDRQVKLDMRPIRDDVGRIVVVVEVRRDVTAERELEVRILRHHHQLVALGRISSAAAELLDLDAVLGTALDNTLEIIDGSVGGILLLDEETGRLCYRVQRGLSSKYAEGMQIILGEGIAGTVAQTAEPIVLEDISKDPRIARPDLVSAEGLKGFICIPLKSKGGKVSGVMNVASHVVGQFGADDVSLLTCIGDYLGTALEQSKLHGRLNSARERYRTLLEHALTAQEEERKRIARELHDETSQSITSVTLSLQAIIGMAEMQGINDEDFMGKLRKTHTYAVHAGNEIVRLMKELRPTLLDELGMPAAIHRYAKDTLQPRGITVSAEFEGTDRRLQPEVEVTLFRIAQGAIGNVLEHSGAGNVFIGLKCDENACVLHVDDDGQGFDVSKITRIDHSGRGAGLFTIKERARLMGGKCRVHSRPGQGTQIMVEVPLSRDIEDEEDTGASG